MQLTCPGKTVSYDSLRPPAGRLTPTGNNTQLVKSMCVSVCVCVSMTVWFHSDEFSMPN